MQKLSANMNSSNRSARAVMARSTWRVSVLDVQRAVKILHPALTADPQFIARFRREAQTAAKLEHPHIVPVYELDEVGGHISWR